MTGFIPARLQGRSQGKPAILFRRNRHFAVLPPGTIVSGRIVLAVDARRFSDHRREQQPIEVVSALSWVVTFLIVALIAGILGFGGIAGASVEIAKAIFLSP